jgi:isoamylase
VTPVVANALPLGAGVQAGRPEPLGLSLDEGGANVAVFSAHATAVYLCLLDADTGAETARIPLPECSGHVWHGYVPGVRAGQHYGLRAAGPFAPAAGHFFNPHKLLLDPYAVELTGVPQWSDALVAGEPDDPAAVDTRDTAALMPRCVARPALPLVDPSERPRTPWPATVLYEAHVRGLTRCWPDLDPAIAGTVEALAAPSVLDHLRTLGVTALELMPLHAAMDEPHLVRLGLHNYWGYNSASFFAPNPRYLGPGGLAGLRDTVRRLHEAGIEVILDVVYNHTAEGGAGGPCLSFRGLDNRSYYQRDAARPDGYANETGCGNRVNLAEPAVLRLVLDSLRWWAQCIGVDGFRFDLAPALLRSPHGFDPASAFLPALLQDPVLRELKLIAEPWDIGPDGYRLGGFPAPFAEWNDRFRDSVRGFWRGDPGTAAVLADGMLGSAQLFDHAGRSPWASVNFVSCHDGFTLADLTTYAQKHNEANGEGNRDGHNHNLADNFGVEGPSDDPAVQLARARRQRSLLATALLAAGTPMLRAGDEIGQTQRGNNNAYCQDNALAWQDWATADQSMLRFTRRLIALRKALPVLQQSRFLHTRVRADGLFDVEWLGIDSPTPHWQAADLPGFVVLLRGSAERADLPDPVAVMLILHNGPTAREVAVPGPDWWRLLDTAAPELEAARPGAVIAVQPGSLVVLAAANPLAEAT